jgi:hypothetical protein
MPAPEFVSVPFLALGATTWLALAGLLALAAGRRYCFHLVPFIAVFAALAALALSVLALQQFVWWYLALSALGLVIGLLRHLRSAGGLQAQAALRQQVLASIPGGDVKQQVAEELKPVRAFVQDAVVDTVVFALVFLGASWQLGRILHSGVSPRRPTGSLSHGPLAATPPDKALQQTPQTCQDGAHVLRHMWLLGLRRS